MRQRLGSREHFRRGNAPRNEIPILIVAGHIRSVDRIELPSTRQPMIWVRRDRLRRFMARALQSMLYAL